jgi:hypothetical protein
MANVPWLGLGGIPLLGGGASPLICDETLNCACDIVDCDTFKACFGISGSTFPFDIDVVVTGIADGTCSTCENFDTTYQFTGLTSFAVADCLYIETLSLGTECGGSWYGNLYLGHASGGLFAGWNLSFDLSEGVFPAVTNTMSFGYAIGAGALAAIQTLCDSGVVAMPHLISIGGDCDGSGATMALYLV